jgi:magnesium-transporting ATPase (P-type)
MKSRVVDERIERVNGQISFIFLLLTQAGLGAVLFYKRYIVGLPSSETNWITWLLGFSLVGYWMLRLYLGGILPVVSFRKLLLIYIIAVAVISILTYLIHGFPESERWYELLFPFIGVGVFMGLYYLVSYFGKKRLEKYLSS